MFNNQQMLSEVSVSRVSSTNVRPLPSSPSETLSWEVTLLELTFREIKHTTQHNDHKVMMNNISKYLKYEYLNTEKLV